MMQLMFAPSAQTMTLWFAVTSILALIRLARGKSDWITFTDDEQRRLLKMAGVGALCSIKQDARVLDVEEDAAEAASKVETT